METRLTREMEKNRSVLAKARGGMVGLNEFPGMGGDVAGASSSAAGRRQSVRGLPPGEEELSSRAAQYDLTEEQRQMFEKGNQDMLKHYESTLDKVRYVPHRARVLQGMHADASLQDGREVAGGDLGAADAAGQ